MRGAGPGLGVRITASSAGAAIGLRLRAADHEARLGPVRRGRSSTPSPASPTSSSSVLTPRRSTSTGLAGSPGFITPESNSVLAVADDPEVDRGRRRSRRRPRRPTAWNRSRAAGQVDPERAAGVRAHAVLELLPADGQRLLADRAVDLRLCPSPGASARDRASRARRSRRQRVR